MENAKLISDYWTFVFALTGAVGSVATAAALGFVAWQASLTRKQVELMKAQLGRAWIEGLDFKLESNEAESWISFKCRNSGQLPARLRGYRFYMSNSEGILVSDILAQELLVSWEMIFPGNDFPIRGYLPKKLEVRQEITFFFGFIVEYEYRVERQGKVETDEYRVIGRCIQDKTGGVKIGLISLPETPESGGWKIFQKIWKRLRQGR